MAEIIDITGVSLGVCEFDPKNDVVYCTHKMDAGICIGVWRINMQVVDVIFQVSWTQGDFRTGIQSIVVSVIDDQKALCCHEVTGSRQIV